MLLCSICLLVPYMLGQHFLSTGILENGDMLTRVRLIAKLRILDSRRYWQAIQSLDRLRFRYARADVSRRSRIASINSRFIALRTLILSSMGSVLPGVTLAIILVLVSKMQLFGTDGIVAGLLSNIPPESASAYDGLLAVILTVTGLFLTLYYTNFNTVIGTLYADFPESVRRLLIDEPQNRTALLALTNFILFALVTLGCGAMLGIRSVASLSLIIVGGVLVVPIFAHVVRRTLFFFDPTHLAHSAIYELSSASEEVMANRHLSSNAAVQHYRSSVASEALDKLNALGQIAANSKNFRQDSFCDLLLIVFGFLPEYQRRKSAIPTNSKWYRQTFRHKDWYLANPTDLEIALNGAIGLIPESVQDQEWLEKSIISMLELGLEQTVAEDDWAMMSRILRTSQNLYAALAAGYQVQAASNSLRSICVAVERGLKTPEMDLGKIEQLNRLQPISELNMLHKQILLSFFEELRELDIKSYVDRVNRIDWGNDNAIYGLNLPPFAVSNLEYLRDRLRLEIETDGEVVSAEWYVCQLALLPIAETLKAQLTELLHLGRKYYTEFPRRIVRIGLGRAAVLTTLDGLEYLKKLKFHASEIYTRMEKIEQFRVSKELPFAKIEKETVECEIDELERQLILNIAQFMPLFARDDYEDWEETPDLLGHAVSVLGNHYFHGLLSSDTELASRVFPSYLVGIICVRESLVGKCAERHYPESIICAAEPLLEAFALGGFAFLFSEYHQESGLWQSCIDTWDKLLSDADMRDKLMANVQLIDHAKRIPMLTGRSVLRSNWSQHFDRTVAQLPSIPLDKKGHPARIRRQVRNHPSLCIRALVSSDMHFRTIHYDPEDIFVDMYLAHKLKLARSWSSRLRNAKQAIKRQQELEEEQGFCFENLEDSAHKS